MLETRRGARDEYGAASSLFDSAADRFEEARDATNTEDARFYSAQAMKRAREKSRQMGALADGKTSDLLLHARNALNFYLADVETVEASSSRNFTF